jgi:hypothetical protein
MNSERLRFIEAFDSVRYTPLNKDPERRIHAEVELMLSLLLGEPIIMSEPYSFDSLSFLEIAYDVICARDAIAYEVKPEIKLACPVWQPFKLALTELHSKYQEMIVDRLKSENFILSSLPDITEDRKVRFELAQHIEKGHYDEASKWIKSYNQYGEGNIDRLKKLNEYFSGTDYSKAGVNAELLLNAIKWIANAKPKDIGLKLVPSAINLKNSIIELEKSGIELTNRGDIRKKGLAILGDEKAFNEVIEYIDGCYNRVIYRLVAASSGMFSTTGFGEDQGIQFAEELSQKAIGDDEYNDTSFGIIRDKSIKDEDLQKILNTSIFAESEKSIPHWKEIWKGILTNDDWIQSVNKLLSLADGPELDDTRNKHLELVSRLLRGSLWKLILEDNGKIRLQRMILDGLRIVYDIIAMFAGIDVRASTPVVNKLLGSSFEMIYKHQVKGSIEKCLRRIT